MGPLRLRPQYSCARSCPPCYLQPLRAGSICPGSHCAYSFGGVLRAISASTAPIPLTTRSNSSIVALNLARIGSGNRACVCCSANASAMIRICLRLRGFSRSHSRRFALRLCPSHCSPVPAGRPVSGSATCVAFCVFVRITPELVPRAFSALCVIVSYFLSAANPSQFTCPSCSTRPVTRSARVSNTSPPYFS
jgi:hypothetical protein